MSDFFLWGGFVFSLLWHFFLWVFMFERESKVRRRTVDDKRDRRIFLENLNPFESHLYDEVNKTKAEITLMNFALSGVALCVFGYLAFG